MIPRMPARERTIGVVSDTHGLVRREVLARLAGCELIVHAGDVGSPEVLAALETVAPVVAVRGNVDRGAWSRDLPATSVVTVGRARLYVLHDLGELNLDPRTADFDAVVSGHSHVPRVERREGVLYLNPGSAGPRRFRLPIACARLFARGRELWAEIVPLAT
jgi:putative phosphoesterase